MKLSEEEKKAIEQLDYELTDSWVHNKGISKKILTLFKKVIENQQKEIEDYRRLISYFKVKLNNIDFETETGWRKIEKLEKTYGEIIGD